MGTCQAPNLVPWYGSLLKAQKFQLFTPALIALRRSEATHLHCAHEHTVLADAAEVCDGQLHWEHAPVLADGDELGGAVYDVVLACRRTVGV